MNPGIGEEAGHTARSLIDALKNEPLALSLVVMNLVLLGLFFYAMHISSSQRQQEVERLLSAQKETSQLLYNCVPHGK